MKQELYKKEKNPLITLVISLVIFFIIIGGGAFIYYNSLLSPVDLTAEEKLVEIPEGYSVKEIANLLEEEEVIQKGLVFEIAVRLDNTQNNLQSGTYLLSGSMELKEIVDKISSGQTINDSIRVTIPEGYEINMIIKKLEDAGLTTEEAFIEAAQNVEEYNYPFLENLPRNKDRKYPLEGYLFPDTYEFSKDATEEEMIDIMLNRFNEVFQDEYYARAEELDMSVDEVVTMASLVEREARHDDERALIAGVYYNRLDIDMKLQCDATVQYALEERKARLLYSDLEIDSPYNTYEYYGLPAGPISSVGEASIKATLYPEDTNYLYYVAKDDGSHVFSRTLAEHEKAIDRVR